MEREAAGAHTIDSLLARLTELELENGRLRAGRRTGSSTPTSSNSKLTDSDAAVEAPSIETLESSIEHALFRCWAASGGMPELVQVDHQADLPGTGSERDTTRNMDLDPEKVDVELLVERIQNSREALRKAESRLAAQAGEIASHAETQEQLTRELSRLQEYEGKYRAFVSAVLRAEQAVTRAAAARESANQEPQRKTGTVGLSENIGDMVESDSQLDHCPSVALPLPPGATTAATAPPVVEMPGNEQLLDSSMDTAPSVRASDTGARALEPSTVPSAAGLGKGTRRGSGDWLEVLAETVCFKLNDGAALSQQLYDVQQQLQQLQRLRLQDSQSTGWSVLFND